MSLLKSTATIGITKCIALAALIYVFYAMLTAGLYGIDNYRLFSIFDDDGSLAAFRVQANIAKDDLDPRGFYNYGYLMHSLGFWLAKLVMVFGFENNYALAALSLKIVMHVSFVASVLLMTWMLSVVTKNNQHLIWYFCIAIIVCFTPSFFFYGWHIHPDIVQIPFICLAIIFFVKNPYNIQNIIVSGAMCGLAFSAKYSAVFTLPFFITYILAECFFLDKVKYIYKPILKCTLFFSAFLTLWLLTNPYVISNFSEFKESLLFEKDHVGYGHAKEESANGFLWFPVIYKEFGMALLMLVMCIPALMQSIRQLRHVRRTASIDHNALLFLSVFFTIIACMIWFFFNVRMREARYLFHLYPFLAILFAYSLQTLSHLRLPMWYVAQAVVLLFSLYCFYKPIPSISNELKAMQSDERLLAGEAMKKSIPFDKQVIVATYSYIPAEFKSCIRTWIFTPELLKVADILVLNKNVPGRYIWPKGRLEESPDFEISDLDLSEDQSRVLGEVFRLKDWKVFLQNEQLIILENKNKAAKEFLVDPRYTYPCIN